MSSFRQDNILYRQGGGYVDGLWVDSGETPIAITASVQPATGKDMQNLPEGRRNGAVFAVYTSTEIKTAEQGPSPTKADQLVIGGVRYEALHVEPWQNNVIPHYRALFARIS